MMKKVDGYKRVIVLGVFVVAGVAGQFFGVNLAQQVDALLAVFGWNAETSAVSPATVTTLLAAVAAMIDGVRKAQAPK